jgi:gliding motility-associated-like protein
VLQSYTVHKNIHSLKKSLHLILGLFLLIAFNSEAANRYWVGGTGLWNNNTHWSLKSGGKGGASIPTAEDNVFIDNHSFSASTQTIKIQGEAVCADLNWTTANAIFEGSSESKLSVYGSFALPSLMTNNFKGKINFLSSSSENKISTGKILLGDVTFNGNGSWILKSNLQVSASVYLIKGSLHTNAKAISCRSFVSKGSEARVLDIMNSIVTIENTWDLSEIKNLDFQSTASELILKNPVATSFRSAEGLTYRKITTQNRGALIHTVAITQVVSNKCSGDCKAVIVATVTGGIGPYVYQWGTGITNSSSQVTDTLKNLCQQSVNVLVQDVGNGGVFVSSPDFNVLAPTAINAAFNSTMPLCFGVCNGKIAPIVSGATPPYSYTWTPGGVVPAPGTLLNACAGSYTLAIKDANMCTLSKTTSLTEPTLLVANGSSTNINCSGVCDGTATTAPSGGTLPYTHSWSNGSHAASISSLCAGSYTDTVKDKMGCTVLYTATISQPSVLALTLTKNNASCGGVCDGKATATLTGGTAPYKYVWSTGSTTTSASLTNTIIGLCAGTYTVTITDKNNCIKTASITVTEPAVLDVTATTINITCFGACNGSATAVVTGGSGGNVYLWTPGNPTGSTTNTITNLCPNTYTVTVHDMNNCISTDIVTITEPVVLKSTPTSTSVSCFGACNGTATASGTGGTLPYTYRWLPIIPPVTTTTISSLCPGTYSLVVTDANSCKDTSAGFTITQPSLLVVNATKSNITCNGLCNGTASANPTGGTAPYTYSWSNGQTTKSISSLCVGNYTVTVTDANACVKTQVVNITQPNLLTVALSSTAISCNGACNATVTSTVGGGTPGYIFSWAPGGETTANISNKCAGTYTLTVTDNVGCIKTATQVVTQPTLLSLTTGSSNISCFGQCNGSASAIAGGGTPPYTYSWAPGNQTTSSITSLCAGSYTVTAMDSKGCTQIKTIAITQPAQIFANPVVVANASCAGLCNGSASSTPIGGTAPYTYLWTPGNTTAATVSSLCQGTYSVKVTDANSCTSTQSITITQPVPVSATISGSTSSCNICNGTATANAAGGTGPYTYSWAPTGQTTVTATGLCPNTTYTVTVTDSKGCTSTATVTILQTIIINITTSSTVLSCAGTCDGIVTANATGGTVPYSFLWAGPGGPYSTQTVTGLCVGAYTVTVSDAAGCFNTDTVTFTNPPVLSVTTSATNLTCFGVCNGTATGAATGGTGAYTYSWMPGGQTTQTATGLCIGTYTLTVKDAKGCTATSTISVTQPTAIVDHMTSTAANCTKADGTITVAPTGGVPPYTYDWGPGTPTGDGTVKVINLFAGSYTLAIRDNSGCISNFNYILNNIAGPTTTVTHANVSCHDACDGSVSVIASGGAGGYTYLWSPGGSTGTSISSICGTTTYTVQVQDASSCITIDTATVINPPLLLLNQVVVNESCGGTCDGSIALNPSGGKGPYTYLWTSGQTTSSISNLCAGNYSVTVKDANNCNTNLTIAILSPPKLTVTLASTNVRCKGACNGTATATVSGGTAAYTYSWTNQPASVVLPAIINLCPNEYIVTVTDSKGCKAKDTVTIAEPTALTSSTIKKDLSCNGVCNGLAVVIASGGTAPYLYAWNPGTISNDTASSLCAGTYNAAVIDANGCFSFPPAVTISEPTIIVPHATSTNPLCNASCNGTAVANPTGGTGTYTYSWLPGGFTTKNISNLCAGTYTVNVKDSAGCTISQNVTLINPSILTANTTSTSPLCVGSCNGTATSNPVGGTPGYTYSWTPVVSTSSTVGSLCSGNYTVVVTDANNCKDTQSVSVNNPLPVNVAISSTPSSCGACDGSILLSPISGTPGFTYIWSGGLPPKSTQTNVCAGIYTVLVTDTLGCDSTFTVSISNSGGPTGETVLTTPVKCFSQCNGSGTVTPIGGTAPYTYLWNNTPIPATKNTAINLCAGNYIVQVTDSSSCIHFSPVTITQPAQILSNATITSAACSGVCTGKIVVSPTGGTGTNAYTYLWTPGGQTTATVNSMCPGTYSLTITDSSLCTKVDSFVVGQSSPLAATVAAVNINCASQCNGLAYIKITTGTPPYSIQWNDPLAQTTDTAKTLCAGKYAVDIKDALGCSITLNVTVTESPAIVAVPTITNATCGACDGQAVLVTSGGSTPYTYSWSNGQTTATVTSLCSGLYTVNIKDKLGCEKSISIPINNTNGPTAATITSSNVTCNALCNGTVTGIIPVGGIAPYKYLWIQSGVTTPTLSNLCAGTYYVRITDSAGCSLVDSVTITSPPALLANQVIKTAGCTICDGEISITPSGGVPPYGILWNTGSTSTKITNLCAGIYTATITDANCSQAVVIPLNTQNGPTVTATSTDIACNDSCNGTAVAIATGGLTPYTVSWSNGATNLSLSNLCAGTYLAQVKGADGCASSASVTIVQQPSVFVNLGIVNDPLCNGSANGTITVVPNGGTLPYTCLWTPAVGTTATITGLTANTYSVTVTDANGCKASRSTALIDPPALTISHKVTNSSCNSTPDGAIDVTTGGGTTPYIFQWSGGSTATTEDLTNVLSGSYTITVTDLHGCRIVDSAVIAPNQFVKADAGKDTTFCQASSYPLSAIKSVNAVSYKWFQLPGNTLVGTAVTVVVNPPTGTTQYYVIADNGTGCTSTDTVQLTSNPLPGADAGPDKSVYIGNSVSIGGNPTTTSAGSTLVWSPIVFLDNPFISNPVSTPSATTIYTVKVTGLNGCSSIDSVVVTLLPTIDIPSGITPNGDGANDVWKLSGIEAFPDCNVELYNRWGELIFHSVGYNIKWDGTYNGKILPVGTYYYIIDLHDPSIPVYTGSLTIMR